MALCKNPKFDIKLHYKRTLEISLIISLFAVIVAFKTFPEIKIEKLPEKHNEPPIDVRNIPSTNDNVLPPPPKPQIDIANPEDIPADFPIDETILDPAAKISKKTKTPPKDDKNKGIEESPIFVAVEELPQPVGGINSIASRINYPELAKKAGIQGTVYVQAIVSEFGDVESAVILKGIKGGCDEEALRVVYETKFTPGKQRGRAVKVKLTIPIRFRLQ